MEVSRFIAAPPQALYDAVTDPQALVQWLPPSGMRGVIEGFEGRVGGGYRMTLTYEAPSPQARGKTTAKSDTVAVRFVELVPGQRIVQAADFVSDQAAFGGTMTMTWSFAPVAGGTEVTVSVENAPPGISEADHEMGIRSSLENLAAFLST